MPQPPPPPPGVTFHNARHGLGHPLASRPNLPFFLQSNTASGVVCLACAGTLPTWPAFLGSPWAKNGRPPSEEASQSPPPVKGGVGLTLSNRLVIVFHQFSFFFEGPSLPTPPPLVDHNNQSGSESIFEIPGRPSGGGAGAKKSNFKSKLFLLC